MASAKIKAIEAKSVHQIQSGQVIVDLCSVVKELVENSLDAGATSIDVRFKNNGLDSVEVHDNGSGIAPWNYDTIALKHFTSKLSKFDDLTTLTTFGFRGEALSSLCALSRFSMITAQADEAPKGKRLEFERSGALKSTVMTACQRGTIAIVEGLFENLPVRRKELSKNVKREYGKVLGLLHAYACIGVNIKFTVRNAMPKAKSVVVFSTKGNATTKENIANVFGAKTLQTLAAFELELDLQPTLTQMARADAHTTNVRVRGHISRPVFGEGRQTPDRQMFFVNGRPCGLPQIAKAINEVYKSFNVSQSPFVFVDFVMDTNAYDVNMSPDKRSIMLHNSTALTERLKTCLTEMFDKHEQTVPQSHVACTKLPAFRQLTVQRQSSTGSSPDQLNRRSSVASTRSRLQDDPTNLDDSPDTDEEPARLLHDHFRNQASTRQDEDQQAEKKTESSVQKDRQRREERVAQAVVKQAEKNRGVDEYDDVHEMRQTGSPEAELDDPQAIHVRDFNARMAEQQCGKPHGEGRPPAEEPIPAVSSSVDKEPPGVVQNAFDRMRPKKTKAEIAIITIDGQTTTTVIGSQLPKPDVFKSTQSKQSSSAAKASKIALFSRRLQKFGAPGTQAANEDDSLPDEHEEDSEGSVVGDEIGVAEGLGVAIDGGSVLDDTGTSKPSLGADDRDAGSDADYIDEAEKRAGEDARVAELIRAAEEAAAMPAKETVRRASKALKGGQSKDSTVSLLIPVNASLEKLQNQMETLRGAMQALPKAKVKTEKPEALAKDEDARLSLTVSKADFGRMKIVGQFNLGFILAVRSKADDPGSDGHDKDELFIIDQHASDEKFNFERLQAETVVGSQRLVRPVNLSLTAVEEEIVLENTAALEKNGFSVEIDPTGNSPVGRRCTLLSLPLSKETTFDTTDMDELIHMLSEAPMLGPESAVPRPSKVRKMFAMRACRSSIMIGKTLSKKQMQSVVAHMGTVDKPWNCPHGRPTMRHLTSLNEIATWEEGDGIIGIEGAAEVDSGIWKVYIES